jgi:UPF0755 protein
VRRLQRGMRLQTDPTVVYALGKSYRGYLTRKDVLFPAPSTPSMVMNFPCIKLP